MEILFIPEMEAMEIPTIYLRMPMRLPAMGMKSQFWEVVLFLNAEAAEPFIFDKSVTVNGNGNTFSNRKGGFILNTDVDI